MKELFWWWYTHLFITDLFWKLVQKGTFYKPQLSLYFIQLPFLRFLKSLQVIKLTFNLTRKPITMCILKVSLIHPKLNLSFSILFLNFLNSNLTLFMVSSLSYQNGNRLTTSTERLPVLFPVSECHLAVSPFIGITLVLMFLDLLLQIEYQLYRMFLVLQDCVFNL